MPSTTATYVNAFDTYGAPPAAAFGDTAHAYADRNEGPYGKGPRSGNGPIGPQRHVQRGMAVGEAFRAPAKQRDGQLQRALTA